MTGKGRGGAPPLPRQRAALRVVQLTLVALALFLLNLAIRSWPLYSEGSAGLGQVIALGVAAAISGGGALWMGFRTVRGPQPPSLD